jgi:hypothetical protein
MTDAGERHIQIGPEFFRNALRDYSNPHWAFVREILQNAMDAKAKRISVSVQTVGEDTVVVVDDDGIGMDVETLETKLLSLGSSGKKFEGTVGGFGKAKEILFFAQKSYRIETQDNLVEGCGASYRIGKTKKRIGTGATVVWYGNHTRELMYQFGRFFRLCWWSGSMILNSQPVTTDLKRGSLKREFGFGSVFANKSGSNTVIVRIHGIPMFTKYTSYKGCIVVELAGSSLDMLTANRDGLVYKHDAELQSFLASLLVDKRSALTEQRVKYEVFEGERLQVRIGAKKGNTNETAPEALAASIGNQSGVQGRSGVGVRTIGYKTDSDSRLSYRFILKNSTGMVTPDYFRPGIGWSSYSQGLISMWTQMLVGLHRITGTDADFSVGFVLDDSSVAECETSNQNGRTYYLNPAKVVYQDSGSRSFQKRFKLTDRYELLALAAHEFVHGLGYGPHDEDYSSRLTELMGQVLRHRKEILG